MKQKDQIKFNGWTFYNFPLKLRVEDYEEVKDILLKIKKNSILEKKIKLYGIFSGILILLIVAFFQPFFFFTETILLYHLANKL